MSFDFSEGGRKFWCELIEGEVENTYGYGIDSLMEQR